MTISEALLDERINNNTTVIIKDKFGGPIVCGLWYQDKILVWGSSEVSIDFLEERNIAIMQML